MIRANWWLRSLLGLCAVLLVFQYLLLAWIIPRYLKHVVEDSFGNTVVVGATAWQFPFTVILKDIRNTSTASSSGLYIEQVRLKLGWVSFWDRTIRLRAIKIKQPWLRLTRDEDGELLGPFLSDDPGRSSLALATDSRASELVTSAALGGWRLIVRKVNLEDGVIEFVDEKLKNPFHGVVDHISIVGGPLRFPSIEGKTTLAVRKELVGHGGHAAPHYCSGWFDVVGKSMDISCQLEPLVLAAFEPYYEQGPLKIRVYRAVFNGTSHWYAKDNELEGRIRLVVGNLDEGDLSLRGSTLVDIQELTEGEPPTLTGEVKIAGQLDDPAQWGVEFIPGNEVVQRLMKPLLDRGKEMIRVRVGGETIEVGLSPATEETMTEIEEASKEVEKSLEFLTTPLAEEAEAPIKEELEVSPGKPEPIIAEQEVKAVSELAPAEPSPVDLP